MLEDTITTNSILVKFTVKPERAAGDYVDVSVCVGKIDFMWKKIEFLRMKNL